MYISLSMWFARFALVLFIASLTTAKEKINLQWAICDESPQMVLQKLAEEIMPPYRENPITYYDERPPKYLLHGLMFRTKTSHGQALSTVKVRFANETSDVPADVTCVWDRYGDEPTYTCEKRCPMNSVAPSVWCDEQIHFAERYDAVEWDGLTPFGPYPNAKWKMRIQGHKVKFDDVAAGSLHLMEIEAKVPRSKGEKAYREITQELKHRGIVLCDPQEGKTRRLFRAMGYLDDEERAHEL
ncbi:hypothetical protein BDV25DRAFT_146542 [Aspergillus avenaceus]|uniref:CYTH-like domain-containing protein n=1 Tax=Aspergillus avenaceus TaxID=36643 RepID=A0A5N6U904_ASPAV|nr:hypothetical protein BDV25DRAFT_146542 [Aspergillus avenaceus]